MKMLNNYGKLVADLVERAASLPCYDASRELIGHRYVETNRGSTLSHSCNIQSTYNCEGMRGGDKSRRK